MSQVSGVGGREIKRSGPLIGVRVGFANALHVSALVPDFSYFSLARKVRGCGLGTLQGAGDSELARISGVGDLFTPWCISRIAMRISCPLDRYAQRTPGRAFTGPHLCVSQINDARPSPNSIPSHLRSDHRMDRMHKSYILHGDKRGRST